MVSRRCRVYALGAFLSQNISSLKASRTRGRLSNTLSTTVIRLNHAQTAADSFSFLQRSINMQNITPLSKPLYIQVEKGQPSPYLKELLSKVGSSEIEFLDFTLEGHNQEDQAEFHEQYIEQQKQSNQMSIIEEEEQQVQEHNHTVRDEDIHFPGYAVNPEQYVPNIHLLEMDPSLFTLSQFRQTLASLEGEPQQKRKQFIFLYLTDEDLQTYKNASYKKLIEVVKFNLSPIGHITRLERKSKVSRYMQKKKKRIWKKKINYDCRKKVADNRLRLKGKFVTREQACEMLGIELCSQDELKNILRENQHKLIL